MAFRFIHNFFRVFHFPFSICFNTSRYKYMQEQLQIYQEQQLLIDKLDLYQTHIC